MAEVMALLVSGGGGDKLSDDSAGERLQLHHGHPL